MTEYVSSALFVYSQEAEHLCDSLQHNQQGVEVTLLALDALLRKPEKISSQTEHVVVSGTLTDIKVIMQLAMQHDFSLGIISIGKQKELVKSFNLPVKTDAAIELALRKNNQCMDLILCNGHILLYKASIGWVPVLDTPINENQLNIFLRALKKLHILKLLKFCFTTASEKTIKTAASGCMVLQHHRGSLTSKLMSDGGSSVDGRVSLLIVSPYSIVEYLNFLTEFFLSRQKRNQLPNIIGSIKSKSILIESEIELDVYIDGQALSKTPVQCEALEKAIHINVGDWLSEEKKSLTTIKESLRIANLPDEKELEKATEKKIPFFSYASEERFRDLFQALRDDAKINAIYIVLMLLSTFLATIGLYMDSTAVIIGAMLLAPLMAPIVSAAMGLLRQDEDLLNSSAIKILIGVIIALLASALITIIFSYKPLTAEMQARLNPTLLDLAVAIISGVAAAYSKSFKEIIQSLAGVAIAVALVPPLAVAGIGLGRGDFNFFLQAFLLFSTNLTGIILAALFTFRALGYSPIVRSRRSVSFVILSMLLIMIPLYLSYERIVDTVVMETRLKSDRYYVNGKYIIVQDIHFGRDQGKEVIVANILVREALNRHDLQQLKTKIEYYFGHQFDQSKVLRVRISYIL